MADLAPGMGQITLSVVAALNLIQDINTYWKTLLAGATTPLAAAIGTTDTSLTLASLSMPIVQPNSTTSGGTYYYTVSKTPQTTSVSVGCTILCDTEEMIVTAISAQDPTSKLYTLTIARGTTQTDQNGNAINFPYAVPAAHAINAPISLLAFGNPWAMAADLWLLPGAKSAVDSLGVLSSLYQNYASGNITVVSSLPAATPAA